MATKTKTNQDGSVDIPLAKPLTIDGAPVSALRMREPTLGDQLAMDKLPGSEAEKEVALVANLCQVAPTDLHALTAKDFKKVQAALMGFLA